jgi:L-amino acid N-acyltransferase YncA
MKFRFVSADDAAALLNIYAQYIDTPITFECALPTVGAFQKRIADISSRWPYIVCEEGGVPCGYAYAHSAFERAAYQWDAELSIYIGKAFTSRGLGGKMYTLLMDILKLQGIRTVYGVVTVPNPASERLHLSLGFRRIGTFHSTGYKCGKWQDVSWFEKQILPCNCPPAPVRSVDLIAAEAEALLAQQSAFA